MKGSIERNVPLGDLNWWPEAKAAWEAKKGDVWAHIQAGNEGQIDIGFGEPTSVPTIKADAYSVYPNPAKDVLNIKGGTNVDVTIMNIDGRIVKSLKNVSRVNVSDLTNGLYSVTVKDGKNVSKQKVLIAR
jgi:hypothetical protein